MPIRPAANPIWHLGGIRVTFEAHPEMNAPADLLKSGSFVKETACFIAHLAITGNLRGANPLGQATNENRADAMPPVITLDEYSLYVPDWPLIRPRDIIRSPLGLDEANCSSGIERE